MFGDRVNFGFEMFLDNIFSAFVNYKNTLFYV